MNDTLKRFITTFIIILTAIFICIDVGYLYLKFVKLQETQISGAFIGNQIDPQSGKEYPLLEVNYFSNQNEKGKEMIEIRLNGFSESTYATIYSRGFQVIDKQIIPLESNNGLSWKAAGEMDRDFRLPIKINEEKYAIGLTGTYEKITKRFSTGKAIWHTISGFFTGYNYEKEAYVVEKETIEYTFEDFINYCRDLAMSKSNGYGDTFIPAIDLAEYFGLFKLENGSYKNVVPYDDTNQSMYYFSAQVHYDYRGVQLAKQSIFNSVAGDSEYNTTGIEDIEYWQTDVNYKLTHDDLDSRFSEENGGRLLFLKRDVINKINNYPGSVVCDLEINLDDFEFKTVGIDWYGLTGLKIKNLKITSSKPCEFKLLDYSIYNTEIQNLEVSENITLIRSENAGGVL